ncbi:MAG TPA: hypothetical protein VFB72_19540 [Verrucomicrobiae bacterium]|nr:hypothetical protein [Verrucomicrobiae bacterium]
MKQLTYLMMAFFVIFLSAGAIRGNDYYVSQNGSGNNSGADTSNTHPLTWANNPANWGTGTGLINPGDTVHLVGTFSKSLVIGGNGLSNQPITIYFEPGANFTSTCWPTSGAIEIDARTNLVIDGGLNGLIQNTANGTGLTYSNNSRGIGSLFGSAEAYNCVFKNLIITNIYKNIRGDTTRAGYGMDLAGSGITVSNCWLSDGDGPLGYAGVSGEIDHDIYLVNNTILNGNHLLQIAAGFTAGSTVSNLVISGNVFDHTDVFEDSSGAHHLDEIIFTGADSGPLSIQVLNVRIFNNIFGGHTGPHNTSSLYGGFAAPGWQWKNWFIYNNLFLSYSNAWSDGFIGAVGGSNIWVVNNTFVGPCFLGFVGGNAAYCYNNLALRGTGLALRAYTSNVVSSSTGGTNSLQILRSYFTNVWSDYNIISGSNLAFGLSLNNTNSTSLWAINSGFDWNGWHTWFNNEYGWPTPIWNTLHCDPHSTTNVPLIVAGTYGVYIPATNDTVAIGKGTNLYWLGITNDFYGNPRSPQGNWTIGAFLPKPAGPGIVLAPSDLSPTNGETVTLTWQSANATSVSLSSFGSVALNGSTNVIANTNLTTYTATAVGPTGTNTAVAIVAPYPTPPGTPTGAFQQ